MSDADEQEQKRRKGLSQEAQRALTEADVRRENAKPGKLPTELGGRVGPDPVRYGDWEKKGIAIDF